MPAPKRPVSKEEEREAQILWAQGLKQAQIGKMLGLCQATISKLKTKGEWSENGRFPQNISTDLLIQRIKIWINRILVKNLLDEGDSFRAVLNISRLTGSLRSLEELNEAVTLRNRIQDAEHLMEWMIERKYSGTLEQIQEYHDEQLNLM